jgi:hypothetical protein
MSRNRNIIFIDGYYIDMYLKFGRNYVCYSWHCEPNEEWNKLYRITEILLVSAFASVGVHM